MVATRGGARTGTDDTAGARKKPERKAAPKTDKPIVSTRLRTNKAKEPPSIEKDDDEDELQGEGSKPKRKPTRQTKAPVKTVALDITARSKRAKRTEEASDISAKRDTTTSSISAKSKSTKVSKPDVSCEANPLNAQKRATRATRATADKDKSSGQTSALSPKKVTQVAKAPVKTVRFASGKAATIKALPRGRPKTRGKESDENADVRAKKTTDEEMGNEIAVCPKAELQHMEEPAPDSNVLEDEAPSPVRNKFSSNSMESTAEDVCADSKPLAAKSETVDSLPEDLDELCGPTTPMHRSPRKATGGLRLGTPHSQQVHAKPIFALSGSKAMTVSRAQGRATVFAKLEPLNFSEVSSSSRLNLEADQRPRQNHFAGEKSEGALPVRMNMDMCIDEPEAHTNLPENAVCEPSNETEPDEVAAERQDSEDTIVIIEDHAEEPISFSRSSLETSESVLATQAAQDADENMMDMPMPTTTPKPETLIWTNIQPEITIPFNFDEDLGLSHKLSQMDRRRELDCVVEPTHEMSRSIGAPASALQDIVQLQLEDKSRQSVDATLHISEFMDIDSLAGDSGDGEDVIRIAGAETQVARHAPEVDTNEPAPEQRDVTLDYRQPAEVTTHEEGEQHLVDSTGSCFDISLETPTRTPRRPNTGFSTQNETNSRMRHYALPTISSARKFDIELPIASSERRPTTSDGTYLPKDGFRKIFSGLSESTRLLPPRPSTACDHSTFGSTRAWSQKHMTESRVSNIKYRLGQTPTARRLFAPSPTVDPRSIQPTPLRSPSVKFHATRNTPAASPPRRRLVRTPETSHGLPAERFPGLPSRNTYEELDQATQASMPRTMTPATTKVSTESALGQCVPPSLSEYDEEERSVETPVEQPMDGDDASTPQARFPERYPGLPHRRTYEEHARTAIPPTRFHTPPRFSARRPMSLRKVESYRNVASKTSTPVKSRSPTKTPLRAISSTPGHLPAMTPHPAAPLRRVVALVEAFTEEGADAASVFMVALQSLGARTTKTFSERVTHLVFKEGSPKTLQKLRVHNKQVAETGIGETMHCVNTRWVRDCEMQGKHMDECDYAVDVDEAVRSGKRRRKSMEPTTLINVDGNVVRDRKSSLGRSSLSRCSVRPNPPADLDKTPKPDFTGQENRGEESPATPMYLTNPDGLILQTAPRDRVKKLEFGKEAMNRRRVTIWQHGA